MKLVSVIIPCYCDSVTLERAIRSVLAQTYSLIEVIVVNDCSPETNEIECVLKAYNNIRYIRNQTNLGLAATRNRGVAIANGDVITFLDADDELHPQKIEMQLKVLQDNTAVTCKVQLIESAEQVIDLTVYDNVGHTRIVTSVSRLLLLRNFLTGAAIMLPKKLMEQVGGYDETLRSCEDYDLWIRLLDSEVTVHCLEMPLYIYYSNLQGLSKNYLNISYWELEVLKKNFTRKGYVLFDSFHVAGIWAFWMFRHLARYEICKDQALRLRTMQNIELLSNYAFWYWLIHLVNSIRLLKLYALFYWSRVKLNGLLR